mgnify:CR=1 FL=1
MASGQGVSRLTLAILFGFLGAVTYMGHRLSAGVLTREDFFNAGGGLPWWAVSTSVIATAISSVTFIAVPTAVFRDGGNLFYIQILMGLMLAKVLTAVVMARPFHQSTDCKTVYDYIGKRTESRIGSFAMVIGLALSSLNTGVRLLTTALVLSVMSGFGLFACTLIVVAFAILWSWIAGLKTVIWTDFLLFIIFTLGAVFSVLWVFYSVEMSLTEAFTLLDERGKLALFDFSVNPTRTYTIWAGLIGTTLGNFALAGTQATYQRVKACRSVRDAQKAFAYAALLYFTPICMLLVGLALAVFYTENPLPASVLHMLEGQPDRIFPYFITTELPDGISGIFVSAIFAAGISTIDTHLTEVSDITISNIYEKFIRTNATDAHYLIASRIALLFWGAFYVAVSMVLSLFQGEGILNLMFMVPNFVTGVILGTIVLARIGIGRWPAYLAGAAVGFMTVYWLQELQVSFFYWPPAAALMMICVVWLLSRQKPEWYGVVAASERRSGINSGTG